MDKFYYSDGSILDYEDFGRILHRLDGPAVEWSGDREWHLNGLLHRLDGPAIESGSRKEWWQNGERHRVDGPAIVWADGTKEWYQNDKPHRLGGPAIEYSNGNKRWFINDKELAQEEFEKHMLIMKLSGLLGE